jgi:hypothetical protein
MERFGYRSPRYPLDLPLRLAMDGRVQVVRCTNVSVDGLQVAASGGLAPRARGSVSFDYEEMTFDLQVSVTHRGSHGGGLRFVYGSEAERNSIAELIARIVGGQSRREVLPVAASNEIVILRRPSY